MSQEFFLRVIRFEWLRGGSRRVQELLIIGSTTKRICRCLVSRYAAGAEKTNNVIAMRCDYWLKQFLPSASNNSCLHAKRAGREQSEVTRMGCGAEDKVDLCDSTRKLEHGFAQRRGCQEF